LSFQGDEGKTIRVLRGVNLTIGRHEIVAVLGPSGCGKTSLLRILAGLLPPTVGAVQAETVLVSRRGLDMTMVSQRPTLIPWLSVEENVFLPYRLARMRVKADTIERADNLFRLVRLQGFRGSYPHELSGGMQMRAALVRALLPRPQMILMDEPFSALDESTRLQLSLEMLHLVEAAGSSVVFVTHSVQEAALVAGRILQMSARPGRIVAEFVPNFSSARDEQLIDRPEFVDFCKRLRGQLVHD
jgi:NitT/TauT family transport system ATP-binding protein